MTTHQHYTRASQLANILDRQFNILGFKFGLDPIIGLVPGFGDMISLVLGSYILWIGYQSQLPIVRLVQMITNLALDFILGLIPVIGDASDFFYHANSKNISILEKHLTKNKIIEGEVL
jgi:hypothetical protein